MIINFGQQDTALVKSLKGALKDCEKQRELAENSLASLKKTYEEVQESLTLANEKNDKLRNKVEELNQEKKKLEGRCKTLSKDIEKLRSEIEEKSDCFIGIIIESLQNSMVLDSEAIGKTQVQKFFTNQMIKILSNFGVSPIEDVGVPVNPKFHKIESLVFTDNPEQSGVISQSLGRGFKKGDGCIVEQPVEIYKYKK